MLEELRALARSPFPKQKADLVIFGMQDSTGQPVVDRLIAIREEHKSLDYRLIPQSALEATITVMERLEEENRRLLRQVADAASFVNQL